MTRRSFLTYAAATSAGTLQAADEDERFGLSALTDGSGFVRIPSGEFLMGSAAGKDDERPPHRVRISRAFDLGKYEITQAQWKSVMTDAHAGHLQPPHQGEDVSNAPSEFRGPSNPVDSVSWYDVQLFLSRLSAFDGQHNYRLPTEAEWEYACKAGQQDSPPHAPVPGWFKENSEATTHPVGDGAPNAWGLFDMLGNVGEWVQDWYAADYYEGSARRDPAGPNAGSYRVFRGGSWLDAAGETRPSTRFFEFPISRLYNVGFRVVRVRR